jgi:hypothetical protein
MGRHLQSSGQRPKLFPIEIQEFDMWIKSSDGRLTNSDFLRTIEVKGKDASSLPDDLNWSVVGYGECPVTLAIKGLNLEMAREYLERLVAALNSGKPFCDISAPRKG